MTERYKIVPYKKIFPVLRKAIGVDFYSKFSYRVETNHGLVYKIDDQIIFLAKNNHDCIVFNEENDLKEMIANDNFPIEEPEWNPFAREKRRILKFHLHFEHYKEFLNKQLGFQYEILNSASIENYLSKVIGRTIKKVATEKETIGLISIVGHKFKELYQSKWIGVKWYGTYNSYLEPNLLTNNNRVIPVSDLINSSLKWKVKNTNLIFNGVIFLNKKESEIGYDYEQYTRHKLIEQIE